MVNWEKYKRVKFMAILDVLTNVPVVIATVASRTTTGNAGISFNLAINLIQMMYDIVYEPLRTLKDSGRSFTSILPVFEA